MVVFLHNSIIISDIFSFIINTISQMTSEYLSEFKDNTTLIPTSIWVANSTDNIPIGRHVYFGCRQRRGELSRLTTSFLLPADIWHTWDVGGSSIVLHNDRARCFFGLWLDLHWDNYRTQNPLDEDCSSIMHHTFLPS